MFDFTPTEEQEALKTMIREFVEREVAPKAAAYDAEPDPVKGIPWDIIKAGNELGLNRLCVREDLGGGGADSTTLGMLVEELARAIWAYPSFTPRTGRSCRSFNGQGTTSS